MFETIKNAFFRTCERLDNPVNETYADSVGFESPTENDDDPPVCPPITTMLS